MGGSERILADDCIQTDADGKVRLKSDVMASIKASLPEAMRPSPTINFEVKVRIYGPAAL